MRKTASPFLSLLLCLFLVNGCSRDVTKEIVGAWRGEHRTFEFQPDNRFEQTDFSSRTTFRGTYSISDGDKVRLRYDRAKQIEVVHTAAISGDELTLTNKQGRSTTMKRESSADK